MGPFFYSGHPHASHSSPASHHNPVFTFDHLGSVGDPKHVHFDDESFTPSSVEIRLKLGPRGHPTMILKISIYFNPGALPRIKVRTRRPEERRKRHRRASVEEERRDSGQGGERNRNDEDGRRRKRTRPGWW